MKGIFYFLLEVVKDWLIYRLRGFAQPDHPNQKNGPLINNSEDACAHRMIDLAKKGKIDN